MKTLRLTLLPLAFAAALTTSLSAQQQNREPAPGTSGGKATRTPDINAFAEASAALDAGPTVAKARAANFSTRDDIVTNLNQRIDSSLTAAKSIEDRLSSLRGEVRTEFKAAQETVRLREQQVRKSLDAARSATTETWSEARSNLAADYEAYAASMTRLETVASVGAHQADARVGAAGTVETKSLEPKSRQ